MNGEETSIRSVDHARSLGIDTVYQDLALVPTLSVAHNMFLNRELTRGVGPLRMLNNGEMRRRARKYLDDIGIRTLRSVQAEVAMLSGGQRQAIAIARSVHSGARILLLDEPLAAMGAKEGEMILDLIRDLKAEGHSMIVVAHNYVHVLEICDRVILLQHGRITLDKLSAETSVGGAHGPGCGGVPEVPTERLGRLRPSVGELREAAAIDWSGSARPASGSRSAGCRSSSTRG